MAADKLVESTVALLATVKVTSRSRHVSIGACNLKMIYILMNMLLLSIPKTQFIFQITFFIETSVYLRY